MLRLREKSLDWALNHALKYGDTDVFPIPFEFDAINHNWNEIREFLHKSNVLEWETRPARTLLSPKAKYGFRNITQLDPLDFIIYASLVYEISMDIERNRIPKENETVFSYRIETKSDGQLFNPNYGYRLFLLKCKENIEHYDGDCVIATTDISDFYSRIYHHRLENALNVVTSKTSHVHSIMRLLSGWNGTETYGIPVGCAPSRVLAEITLSDIDEALMGANIDFIRFNDDYRIFADNHKEAYKQLVFLAEILYKNHGLSLQQQKTSIYESEDFTSKFLTSPPDREMDTLEERFEEFVEKIGLESWYEEINYDDLNEEQQELIDALNLVEIFRSETEKDEPDIPVVKFVLRRLTQLGDDSAIKYIYDNLETLIPAFADVIKYISSLRYLDEESRSSIGEWLLSLLKDSIVSELEYHRMWILSVFTQSQEWDNENKFINLYNQESNQSCKRKLILAMGRAKQIYWFKSQWRSLFEHPHWQRRAVLAAASCMPLDARKHWYKSIISKVDILEKAVIDWAKCKPFC